MPDDAKYQQLIGELLYLAVNTKPDISTSVAILSQHNKQPTTADWTEVERVACYLKGTMIYDLTLGQPNTRNYLIGFADADWAQDTMDRKSRSGYLFQSLGISVSWSYKKQTSVALSLTKMEYIALAEAIKEGL